MNSQKIIIWPAGLIAAAVIFLASATAIFAASPGISFTGSTTPFSTLTVSGSGFGPNETVHVALGSSSYDIGTDGAGSFSGASIVVPNVSSGSYVLLAFGEQSGLVAFNYVYVSAFYPTANPSSWYATPGSSLTWSGSGFAPNEQVTVSNSGGQIASFNADSSGAFSGQGASTVPYSSHGGSLSYTVHGAGSGTTIPVTIGVANLYPWVNPSSWYTLPGSAVTFSGGGFGPGEVLDIFFATSSTPISHITTDASGNFTGQGQVTIPYGVGTALYRVVGEASGAEADAPITRALFYPSLSPSAYYSAPGGFITLGGSGFVPDEYVDVVVGGVPAGVAHADGLGAFSGLSIHMPTMPSTVAAVSATGELSGATANFGEAIGAYYTWMNLSSWWATGGTALTITGHNFAAGEVVGASSGSQDLGSGTADNGGDVIISTHVPLGAPGPAPITLTGQTSGAPASVTMTIAPVWTDYELGSYAGAPGGAVHFIGHGYEPGEQVLIATDRTGTTPILTLTTDSTGSFDDSSWSVPGDFTEGNLVLTATAQSSGDSKAITYYVTGL